MVLLQMPNRFALMSMGNMSKPIVGVPGEVYVYYCGSGQPAEMYFNLPEGESYLVDVIDTWDMTVSTLAGTYSGSFRVALA